MLAGRARAALSTARVSTGTTNITASVPVTHAATNGWSTHPAKHDATIAGARRLRRMLSKIFQPSIARSSVFPRPKSHGSICQSPRTQRCIREAATSYDVG